MLMENRSWIFIGVALRFGYALGLHLHSEDDSFSAVKKEVLARIWWGHYTLETLLAAATGRPSTGFNGTCSVPLPLPLSSAEIEEAIIESRFGERRTMITRLFARKTIASLSARSTDSPTRTLSDCAASNLEPANSGSYLKSVVQLGEITNAALNLYESSTSVMVLPWSGVQEHIVRLTEDLDFWAASLPDDLDFDKRGTVIGHKYEREKNTLEMLFHGTKILVTRPCLRRLDRCTMNQKARLSEFNESIALICVQSARSIAWLLPNRPDLDVVRLYEAGPWWCMVHAIMQSLAVLLLELTYEASYSSYNQQEILPSLKKLVRWLRVMQAKNAMAKRAYSIAMHLLRASASKIRMVSRQRR